MKIREVKEKLSKERKKIRDKNKKNKKDTTTQLRLNILYYLSY